jgi:L-asparaginase
MAAAAKQNRKSVNRRSVYVAYTGGTVGMRRGVCGYEPARGHLAEQMASLPVFERPEMPGYEIHEYAPLLDSANMTPRDWMKIADDLMERYDDYDGFIVLHGTDTMAYSASALSFLFEDLGKTVLFTGSQIPLEEVRSDAYDNLITSLLIAAESPVPEVCLFVGNRLLRGNRSTKVSAERFEAFESPNYRPLGRAGVYVEYDRKAALARPTAPVRLHRIDAREPQVADVVLFPGITAATLGRLLEPPLEGAVLHTYGAGNAPDDLAFLAVLRGATERGVVLVNCTQCLEGSVRMREYATGNALREAGVVSGFDMTPEAALTKLYCLLARGLGVDEVRRLVQRDLRGELTRPQNP